MKSTKLRNINNFYAEGSSTSTRTIKDIVQENIFNFTITDTNVRILIFGVD